MVDTRVWIVVLDGQDRVVVVATRDWGEEDERKVRCQSNVMLCCEVMPCRSESSAGTVWEVDG